MEKEQQSERDKSPDFDDISLQKLEAQKAVSLSGKSTYMRTWSVFF